MFAMKEYPHDVMPLYSQGYSVARFLIANGGKQKFLEFLGDGMRDENWSRAIQAGYGYSDLAALQGIWLDWVRQGSPALDRGPEGQDKLLAANDRRSRPSPNLIYRGASPPPDFEPVSAPPDARPPVAQGREIGPTQLAVAGSASQTATTVPATTVPATAGPAATGRSPAARSLGWHAPGAKPVDVPVADELASADSSPAGTVDPASVGNDANHQVTRPQPTEQARQIILEWSKTRPPAGTQPAGKAQTPSSVQPATRTPLPGGTASVYNQTATR
jgi:hypothetical protein